MGEQDRVSVSAKSLVQPILIGGHETSVDMPPVWRDLCRSKPANERSDGAISSLRELREQIAISPRGIRIAVVAERKWPGASC